ncbi:hypothetical protein CRUP_035676 [Coryphaenoides rupestris]|nr:hypothetical protein CRUP_035676 [Coryphaenoides rupestris]
MTWRPQYRCSKFRHVFGKPASKESCYDGVPITRSVQDNHFCAVNPRFLAIITECAGGGSFLVLPIHHAIYAHPSSARQLVRTRPAHSSVPARPPAPPPPTLPTISPPCPQLPPPRLPQLRHGHPTPPRSDTLASPTFEPPRGPPPPVSISVWGDGSFKYYEISVEKPYLHYLSEFRSLLPQKGMGVMPKRGLDSESYQEDIYPMTPGNIPAMTSQEWVDGVNRDPVLINLKPGSQVADAYQSLSKGTGNSLDTRRSQSRPGLLQLTYIQEQMGGAGGHVEGGGLEGGGPLSNGQDLSPPKTESERDVRITQLELEINNVRNSSHNS